MGQRNSGERRERRLSSSRSDSPQILICSLCGHLRSSRRRHLGPKDIFDEFICSRTTCGKFKAFLEHFLSRWPIIQINYYNSPSSTMDATTKAFKYPENTSPMTLIPVAELAGESSISGRVELPGDFTFRSFRGSSLRSWLRNEALPPSVN